MIVTAWAALREQFSPKVVSHRAAFFCGLLAVSIGFTNAVSLSVTEILLGIMAFCWLLSGGFREQLSAMVRNPVAIATLAIIALLSISVFYGAAPLNESLHILRKYRTFAYLLLFIAVFSTERRREGALLAFCAAMTLILAGSLLTAVGISPIETSHNLDPANATVFSNHIVHGLCMALFAYLVAHRFVDHRRWRWVTGPLALLAIWNTLFMVDGRTGYAALAVLIALFCVQQPRRLRNLAFAAAAGAAIAGVGYYHSETNLSERTRMATEEVSAYLHYRFNDGPVRPEGWRDRVTRTSCGIRLEMYRAGLHLFAQNPLLGVGIGNVRYHLETSAKELRVSPTYNLHSEYVMAAAQNGLLGLGLLGALFVAFWRSSRSLSPRMRYVAEGIVVVMLVAGTVNTLVTERIEGTVFAFFTGLAFGEFNERVIRRRREQAFVTDQQGDADEEMQIPRARAA